MNRLGPIRIEYWCDGCSQIQIYKGGSIGCKETGDSLYGLSNKSFKTYKNPSSIPCPSNCPYLLKTERKNKLNELNENSL